MAGISKKEIKEVFIEALEPFAKSVQEDFSKVNGRLDTIDGRLDTIDGRLDTIDGRLDTIDGRLDNLERDVKWMKENSSELFAKLDEFIFLFKKQEQEMIILSGQLKRLEERVAQLETKTKN